MSIGIAVVVGIVIGATGVLFAQAAFVAFMDWWADVLDTFGYWVSRALGVCGILFVLSVIAVAEGWRPGT